MAGVTSGTPGVGDENREEAPPERIIARRVRKGGLPTGAQRRRLASLKEIASPHLPRLISVEEHDEEFRLNWEYIDGAPLTTVRGGRAGLTMEEAWRLLADLAGALKELHAHGVIHGDISPANIIVRRRYPKGRAVVVDVGGEEEWEVGTAGFRAPELLEGGHPSAAGDVWSAARVALWAVAAEEKPAFAELLQDVLQAPPPSRLDAAGLEEYSRSRAVQSITLPDDARLATAHLRASAAIRPTVKAGKRARKEKGRLPRAGVALTVVALACATYAAVDAVDHRGNDRPETTGMEPTGEQEEADPRAVLEELTELRDRALSEGDRELLAGLSAPGSQVARGDAALLESFRGSLPAGLQTSVEAGQVSGEPEEPVVEAHLQQGPFTWEGGARAGVHVAELPPRCARFSLRHTPEGWVVHEVSACAAEEMSG